MKNTHNHWTEEKILSEIKSTYKQLGHSPTCPEMNSIGKSGLSSAITRSKKGLAYYYDKLEIAPSRRSREYWKENLNSEIKKHIDTYGHFPTQKELSKNGKSGLSKAMNGQVYEKAKKFGLKHERSKSYWNIWENLEKEIKPLITDGFFPTLSFLNLNLGGGAARSIMKFGGIQEVAKKMGYNATTMYVASDGHYLRSMYELIFDELLYANKIPHETNGLIPNTKNRTYDFKIGDLYVEIWGMKKEGKIGNKYQKRRKIKEKIYENGKLKLLSIEPDTFKGSKEEICEKLSKILKENNLNCATSKIPTIIQNHMEIWTEEKIIKELLVLIDKFKHFPTRKEFIKAGKKSLFIAISKRGGSNYFASKTGYKCKAYTKWNYNLIKEELQKIKNKINRIPSYNDLPTNLMWAIKERGGINFFLQD